MSKAKNSKSLNLENANLEIGKSYYNVMEVFKNKVTSSIIEKSQELRLDREVLEKISLLVSAEFDSAKSWGYDQIKLK